MGRPSTPAGGARGYSPSAPPPDSLPSDKDIRSFIENDRPTELVSAADKIGSWLKRLDLKTSQIRNVFGTVRKIQLSWDMDPARWYRETVLLMPKLGYYAEREKQRTKTEGMKTLERVLLPAIEAITDADKLPEADKVKRERFMRFADFFEAIVAYHKKYGGREN